MFAKSSAACLLALSTCWVSACYGQKGEVSPRQASESAVRPDLARVAKQITDFTNDFRREEGRGKLRDNSELAKAAQYFAHFISETDKYGHTADGQEPWDRAKKYGYDYCMVEENIAYQLNTEGFTTRQLAEGFFNGWKESPGHRRNMLNPNVDETAVAVARSAKSGKYYAVQMFGRPKSQAIKFSVSNRTDGELKYTVDGQTFTLKPRFTQTHEVCTPPKVVFSAPDQGKAATGEPKSFQLNSGARFIVRHNGAGQLVIDKE